MPKGGKSESSCRLKKTFYHSTQKSIVFGVFTAEEIKKLSVVKVHTPLTFTSLGHSLSGGLYDPALGPTQKGVLCGTCSNHIYRCIGHMGHIDLPLPVINPLFYNVVSMLLTYSCLSCHNILISKARKTLLINQLKLLSNGCVIEAMNLADILTQVLSVNDGLSDDALSAVVASEINNATAPTILKDEVKPVDDWKQVEVLRDQFITEAKQHVFKGKHCPHCKEPLKKLKTVRNKIMIEAKVEVAKKFKTKAKNLKTEEVDIPVQQQQGGFVFLLPTESRAHLRNIWAMEEEFMKEVVPLLKTVSDPHPTDIFFMTVVPVTPINTRPVNFKDGTVVEHPQNHVYKSILQDCVVMRGIIHLMNKGEQNESDKLSIEEVLKTIELIKGSNLSDKLHLVWSDLQKHCDFLVDKYMGVGAMSANDGLGLKQLIEKKEGVIRMHMMGKRVNFAARSVITPDPNLNIDEIGIPDIFAKKLTYPVPVTAWNVAELRKMVMNGPDVHPGALFVEGEDGFIQRILPDSPNQREGIAKTLLTPEEGSKTKVKVVHRHLLNGDILLLNRQPTLHKPSIMGHKARILKGDKTIRLHYANCKAYNADFDGDEMNAHFPQSELGRSEAYNLVSVCKNYLVPKDGTPLSGLIQDHVISGVRLSMRDSFFNREDYMNLVFQALSFIKGDIKTLPPAIIKPTVLWSGKQILSTVIINLIPAGKTPLNLKSTAKISLQAWEKGPSRPWKAGGTSFPNPKTMTECEVIIRGGELLCGVFDKTQFGATPYSLVHCMFELYGGEVSSQMLSSFAKLFTAFLQLEGFTLGVEDILVLKKADKKRQKYIKEVRNDETGIQVAASALGVPLQTPVSEIKHLIEITYRKDPKFRSYLDHQYKKCLDTFTNNINKACLPAGLLQLFPANNLQLMVQSGAKGSTVNTMQISCLLGQIELEGKRPPIMLSGRSLPSFPPYELTPRAGGFIDGRFMTGIQPQEFFFHCMAGREGLIDTAVKTSRSGYLQRCLIKHLEGVTVRYDLTVRDSDNSIVQYRYGEDGMEVMKSQFLNKKQIPFLAENIVNIMDKSIVKQLKNHSNNELIEKHAKLTKSWNKKHQNQEKRRTGFTLFSEEMSLQLSQKSHKKISKNGRSKAAKKICKMWMKLDEDSKNHYEKQAMKRPDPLSSQLQPDVHFRSISEKLETLMNDYLTENNISGKEREHIRDMISLKSSLSVCSPGEPVGLLAAQSVGEPSTQMTLNTFHFAGRGEMNVTLGIPRLREILMVASKSIKTPSMEVPFLQNLTNLESKAEELRKRMTRTTLANVLEYIEVTEHLDYESVFRNFTYTIHFQFLPNECYRQDYNVKPKQILRHVERIFISEVLHNVHRRSKMAKEVVTLEADKEGPERPSRKRRGNDEEDQEIDAMEPETGGTFDVAADSSEEESVADDEDATAERRRMRQKEGREYQDPEDGVEKELEDDDEGSEQKKTKIEEEEEEETEWEAQGVGEEEYEDREREVLQRSDNIRKYRFDTESQLWCEVTLCLPVKMGRTDLSILLKELAYKSTVSQVKGIRRAFIQNEPVTNKLVFKTDGRNFSEVFRHHDLLDINHLYCNDIHAVAETYGIEAAAKVIVKEIQDVFKVYGITVDPRHLLLIADYMTCNGTYQPMNRIGMEGGNSPLQQMSFESSLKVLRNAVLNTRRDKLYSPSARIMTGLPVQCGTSAFQLIHQLVPNV